MHSLNCFRLRISLVEPSFFSVEKIGSGVVTGGGGGGGHYIKVHKISIFGPIYDVAQPRKSLLSAGPPE